MQRARLWACAAGIAAAGAVGASAKAEEPGLEWKQVAEDEAQIAFNAPGLEGGLARFYESQDPYKYHKYGLGRWVGPSGRYPHATVYVTKLGPGYHFEIRKSTKQRIENWLGDKGIKFGDDKKGTNALGRVSYLEFNVDTDSCIAFTQYWGQATLHDGPNSDGTAALYGYYCVDAADALPSETVASILNGIKVKK